jgi:hypothetical protein
MIGASRALLDAVLARHLLHADHAMSRRMNRVRFLPDILNSGQATLVFLTANTHENVRNCRVDWQFTTSRRSHKLLWRKNSALCKPSIKDSVFKKKTVRKVVRVRRVNSCFLRRMKGERFSEDERLDRNFSKNILATRIFSTVRAQWHGGC